MFGEVRKEQSEEEIASLFAGVKTGVFAYGHVHMPNIRKVGDITLANISSVNIPQDGDGRAKYGILTWDQKTGWTVTYRRIAYNVHKELELLSFVQPPDWESISKRTMP
jgi:predicted phosphodiesterase